MKLLQAIVSRTGFRDQSHNPARLEALDRLLGVAGAKGADLVLLPGGYLVVNDDHELSVAVADVSRRASAAGVVVAFGVDLPDSPRGKGARAPVLPYYGAVCGAVAGGPWRQTSSTGQNAADVTDKDVPGAGRVVEVAGCRVGVLICGELFSWWARQSFANQNLNLALDLGHYSMATGVTRAMENIARNGSCAVAHTHHVAPHSSGSLHFVRANGERESVPISDCDWSGDEDFWVAWRVREV